MLSIWRTDTVSKLIPLRELKKVLEIVTLDALLTTAGNVSADKAGSDTQSIVATDSKALMERVESRVRLLRVKSFPMDPIVVLPKLVKPPAFSQTKEPVIC